MEAIFDFVAQFVIGAIFDSVDEITKKHKKVIRRTIITVFAISAFAFFIAIPILGETGGKSVLGLVLISLLPIELIVMIVIFIISKMKKKK